VDTSGSINPRSLDVFLSEVRAILHAYPHLRCDLYYADSALHGPFPLTPSGPVPPPVGGGGTDFRPFFERLETERDSWSATVAVYLTDGYGDFPAAVPSDPVLWVVTPGGLDVSRFPFGEAVRLTEHIEG
jgi:predicted metal-dependent peptidase